MSRTLLFLFLLAAPTAAPAQDPGDGQRVAVQRTADDALSANLPGCSCRFDRGGATLQLPASEGVDASGLTLRLTDWSRGGTVRTVDGHRPEQVAAGRVVYRHDGLVESYRQTNNGFEQSFEIAARPPGGGDLVLGVSATSSTLRAAACEAAQQELEFRRQQGDGIRYGEALAFGRGGRPVAVATRFDGVDRIELIVPAALLDSALYPLVVDPAVSPLFNPGGANSQDYEPDAAQALAADRYMVVWRRDVGGSGQIRAQVHDGDGNAVSGVVSVTTSGSAANPCVVHTVVGGADRFCIVYERNGRIEARLYDLAGSAVTSSAVVTSPAAGVDHHRPSASGMHDSGVLVAWDSTPYQATTPKQIEAQLLSFSGTTIFPGVVRIVDSLIAGFTRRPRLPKSHVIQVVSGVDYAATRMVWERSLPTTTASPTEVWTAAFAMRLPSGLQSFSLAAPARIAGTAAGGDYEELPDIGMLASSGNNPLDERLLLAWQGGSGDIVAALYDLDGPLAAPIQVADSPTDFETEPAVLAGTCEFSVGYRSIGTSQRIRVRSFRRDGTPITSGATTLHSGTGQYYATRGASRQLSPQPQSQINRVLFAWQDSDGPASAIWDVRARFYQAVAGTTFPFGAACPGPGGTLPQIGTIGTPDPGNLQFAMRIDSAPANALAALVVSTQFVTVAIPGAPGCALYVGLPFDLALPVVTDASGTGSVGLPIPCGAPPGVAFATQWGVLTPGFNAFGWITSDDLDFQFYP